MRSPWIDLLFLHGYITTPTALSWRPDAPPCDCNDAKKVAADVSQLPLKAEPRKDSTCCA
jgi:hypothetical protein